MQRITVDKATQERRDKATQAFHERAAFHLARVGRHEDAAEAREAAEACRKGD